MTNENVVTASNENVETVTNENVNASVDNNVEILTKAKEAKVKTKKLTRYKYCLDQALMIDHVTKDLVKVENSITTTNFMLERVKRGLSTFEQEDLQKHDALIRLSELLKHSAGLNAELCEQLKRCFDSLKEEGRSMAIEAALLEEELAPSKLVKARV